MKKCRLCGKSTNGSIGAAGIKWTNICQDCKDIEDNALLESIKKINLAHKMIGEMI